jgi:hypothetical protein
MADPDQQSRNALNRGAGAYSTPGVDTPPAKAGQQPYTPLTATPVTQFRLQQVDPPSNLYVRPPEAILLRGNTNLAGGDTVNIVIRILRADGTITTELESLVVVPGFVPTNLRVSLPEGYLLNIAATATVANFRGATYCAAFLIRIPIAGPVVEQGLFGDYVTSGQAATWPNGRIVNGAEGPGNLRSITGTVPAAGAEISEIVPGNMRWRLMAFRYSLTTAVAVANRESNLTFDDGANVYASETSGFTEAASLTDTFSWMLGVQRLQALQSTLLTLPLPSLIMPGLHRIRTNTANIQAADQYTAPQYLVEEWAQTT